MAMIYTEQEIASLARAAQAGQAEAFGKLYDAFIRKLYDFIYYKTLNKEVAEDITSTVFMKAWKNIQQCNADSFLAWLYTIARRAVIDYYRQHRENRDIDDCWDLASEEDFIGQIDGHLKIESIKEAMRSLKNEDREIIIMRFWMDLTFKEIAQRVGKKEGAVKMALSRSLTSLRLQVPVYLLIMWPNIINICKKIN